MDAWLFDGADSDIKKSFFFNDCFASCYIQKKPDIWINTCDLDLHLLLSHKRLEPAQGAKRQRKCQV